MNYNPLACIWQHSLIKFNSNIYEVQLSMEFIIHYKSFTAGEVILADESAEHVVLVCQLVSPMANTLQLLS